MLRIRSIIVLSSLLSITGTTLMPDAALAAIPGFDSEDYSLVSKPIRNTRRPKLPIRRTAPPTPNSAQTINRSTNRSISSTPQAKESDTEESTSSTSRTLSGNITAYDVDDSDHSEITRLTDLAFKNDQAGQYTDELVKRFSTRAHKALVVSKEFAYSMVPYRGFGPSKEGVSIITENVKKIKSLPAAQYMKQRINDDIHSKVVASLLQIAMGLDCPEKMRSDEMVKTGYDQLAKLVGPEQATKTVNTLTGWSRDLAIAKTAYDQPVWDVCSLQKNIRNITADSLHSDAAVASILKNVTKYDRGKLMSALGIAVQTGCAIGTVFSPGLLLPMATEVAASGFTVATGGNEDTKLVNELYYAKALESRWKSCNEEAQMALGSYQMALQSHSPTLMATCETVLNELVGSQKTAKILGQSYLATLPNYSRDKALAGSDNRDKIVALIDSMLRTAKDNDAAGKDNPDGNTPPAATDQHNSMAVHKQR